MSVPGWYDDLELYNITINAWEMGIIMGAVMQMGCKEKIPRLWKMMIELKKSIEAESGVEKEFLPDGRVRLTHSDGVVITRQRFPWDVPDEG